MDSPCRLFLCAILICSLLAADGLLLSRGRAFNKWPDTGQQLCYDNELKEDGSYQEDYASLPTCPAAGEPFYGQDAHYPMIPRDYTRLKNGDQPAAEGEAWIMVRDNVTGLVWEVKTDDGTVHDRDNTYSWCDPDSETNGGDEGSCGDGTDTADFIEALNNDNFGGHNDWRLPTIKELSSITHAGYAEPAVDTAYFPQTAVYGRYWSATTNTATASQAWYCFFALGNTYHYGEKDQLFHVRAVRGSSDEVPVPHFTDNGDGTITDNATGLIWQKCSMGQVWNGETNGCDGTAASYSWEQALAESEQLSLAGSDDWRLPNRKELQSLVDYTTTFPATAFPGPTEPSGYWSSSSNVWHSFRAWYLNFAYGNVYSYYKVENGSETTYRVRAVRGFQSSQPFELSVTWSGEGSGRVVSTPAGLDCSGEPCAAEFPFGTFVTLEAVADAGSIFMGWSGNGDCGDGQVTINEAKSCIAVFRPTHEITVTVQGHGTVEPPGPVTVIDGEDQLFTITPEEHFHVVGVKVDDEEKGPLQEYRFTGVAEDHTLGVEFGLDSHVLAVTLEGSGQGRVVAEPAGIDCPGSCSGSYAHGTPVTLTAVPEAGAEFTGWSGGGCLGTDPCTVIVSEAGIEVSAEFTYRFPWSIYYPLFFSRPPAEEEEASP